MNLTPDPDIVGNLEGNKRELREDVEYVRARWRSLVADLPVQHDGPDAKHMLDEFKGLARARKRAIRRMLGC